MAKMQQLKCIFIISAACELSCSFSEIQPTNSKCWKYNFSRNAVKWSGKKNGFLPMWWDSVKQISMKRFGGDRNGNCQITSTVDVLSWFQLLHSGHLKFVLFTTSLYYLWVVLKDVVLKLLTHHCKYYKWKWSSQLWSNLSSYKYTKYVLSTLQ